MPELPEVEALRRGLLKYIVGSKILEVKVLQEKIISGKGTTRKADKNKTKEFIDNLVGKKIVDVTRRAKNLTVKLNTREIILVHLKMTGQLVFVGDGKSDRDSVLGGHPIQESEVTLPHKHTYIIFKLNNGTLYYNDVRQFGYVLYFKNEKVLDEQKHFENIGMEPFDKEFTLEYFKKNISKYKSPIKKILLDQKVVVGCGNIYCDEVLWKSSVLPTRLCNTLNNIEIKKIYENIILILDRAINSGGSSVANYLLADGKRGNYADFHNVYQKDGTKCKFPKCKGMIEKTTFVGRGTHFCPAHQH